jgi:hypothetical protein
MTGWYLDHVWMIINRFELFQFLIEQLTVSSSVRNVQPWFFLYNPILSLRNIPKLIIWYWLSIPRDSLNFNRYIVFPVHPLTVIYARKVTVIIIHTYPCILILFSQNVSARANFCFYYATQYDQECNLYREPK